MTSSIFQEKKAKDFHFDPDTGKIYFTYEDLKELPDWPEGPLIEVIGGDLFMVPSPDLYHQEISANLMEVMRVHVKQNELGKMWSAPVDVILSPTEVVIPDLVFVSKSNDILTEKNIKGAPDLVIEILSSNREQDLVTKKNLYEKYGVREYWIVDPVEKKVFIYQLESKKFEMTHTIDKDKTAHSKVLDLKVDLSKIF